MLIFPNLVWGVGVIWGSDRGMCKGRVAGTKQMHGRVLRRRRWPVHRAQRPPPTGRRRHVLAVEVAERNVRPFRHRTDPSLPMTTTRFLISHFVPVRTLPMTTRRFPISHLCQLRGGSGGEDPFVTASGAALGLPGPYPYRHVAVCLQPRASVTPGAASHWARSRE